MAQKRKASTPILTAKNAIRGAIATDPSTLLDALSDQVERLPMGNLRAFGAWIDTISTNNVRFSAPSAPSAFAQLQPKALLQISTLERLLKWVSELLSRRKDVIDRHVD